MVMIRTGRRSENIDRYEFSNPNAARGFLESMSRKMLRRGYMIQTMRKNPAGTEKHLEYHNDALNSHKYWSVWIEGAKVFVEYGRMPGYGQKPTTREVEHDFNSEVEATQYATKKIAEKIRKGYSETKWHNVGIARNPKAKNYGGMSKQQIFQELDRMV